jgi:replicative DNA helicase
MLDWAKVMPEAIESIGSGHDIFYDQAHQNLYRIMVEMYDAQEPIDLVTLRNWLEFQALLDQVGGLSYLATLSDTVPSASNLSYYLAILHDKWKARKLIRFCTDNVANAYGNTDSPDELISQAATEILNLAEGSVPKNEEATVQSLLPDALAQIESWHSSQGALTGIGTGFTDLDKMTTGFHAGEMIVIAGRPSLGKTSLSMNIADHVAVNLGIPVGVFSLEMTKASLVVRMLCSRARTNVRRIQAGFLSEADFPRLTAAASRLHASKIVINDQSGLSILGLRTRARRMVQQHGIGLLVIDYLQLMSAERNKNDSREQEVSFISKGVKGLAKELGIPVIALSQLNRGIEKDKERRPRMSDLRESGSLEQDADFVGILWKPSRDTDEDDGDATPVNLEVCKQRNGPTGTVPLTFMRQYTRFESCAKVSDSDAGYQSPYADAEPPEPQPQQEMPI